MVIMRGEALYGWVWQKSIDERHLRRAAPPPSASRRSPRDSASRGRRRRQRLHRRFPIRAKTGSKPPAAGRKRTQRHRHQQVERFDLFDHHISVSVRFPLIYRTNMGAY
jgi:hypothetical protein